MDNRLDDMILIVQTLVENNKKVSDEPNKDNVGPNRDNDKVNKTLKKRL